MEKTAGIMKRGNMFLTRKSSRWANASSLIASRSLFGGIKPENLVILKTVWEKEMSGFAKYCELEGVEKNFVVVKAANSVVASELFLRRDEILKNLNKHFRARWIKGLRITSK